MSEQELTKLCAEAMGHSVYGQFGDPEKGEEWWDIGDDRPVAYDPLHDDAQAMALVKRFKLALYWDCEERGWCVAPELTGPDLSAKDLNRAIVECVAKMQSAKIKEAA